MSAKQCILHATFGRWKIIKEGAPGSLQAFCQCSCEVKTERWVNNTNLTNGASVSCGCYKVERIVEHFTKHGHSHHGRVTKIYQKWAGMIQRCENANHKQFKDYGGRGIAVCERWHTFENYLSDMGIGKKGWTVHRVDNDGGYFVENCVWATQTFQARHTRANHVFTVHGVTACLSELCELFHLPYNRIKARLRRGWPVEKAFK